MRAVRIALLVAVVAGAALPARAEAACGDTVLKPAVATPAHASCESDALGGTTHFSYFVPDACTQATPCPVLYLLHGFGGVGSQMIGEPGSPSAFVRALTHDPVTGADLDDLDLILVAPTGKTVASTRGGAPPAGQESFWVDWNPRYTTSPPRFEAFVTEELRGLVERSFPTVAARGWRGIDGVSLGGFGSFKLAFQHPDLYATAGSISGALNILVAPGPQPVGAGPTAAGGIPETTYARPNGVAFTPPGFPFGDPFRAFGDPVADETYFRGNNPLDLALNARGLHLRFFHNDTVPRSAADLSNPASFAGAYALEAAVMPMNLEMRAALAQHGHGSFTYELHPGLHSGPYWDPYIRPHLEELAAQLGRNASPPETFSYRSTRDAFEVWGWEVSTSDRAGETFTTLWNAGPDGFSVSGAGVVRVRTPSLGIAGARASGPCSLVRVGGGSAEIECDFGRGGPTDEHANASGIPGYHRAARVEFLR